MIWIWIAAAILLSLVALKGKKISFENLIWILLPVDMYGISMGFTLKPYMIFSVILLIRLFIKKNAKLYIGGNWYPVGIFLCFAAFVVNFFNGGTLPSVMSIMMVIVVYGCALIYVSNIDNSFNEIPDVIVAASIGYGAVFIFAYLVTQMGGAIEGAATVDRMTPGIVMRFGNMLGGNYVQAYRLRGFNIDPNTLIGVFLAAISVDVITIFSDRENKKESIVSIVVCILCIIFSNSRMGLACGIVTILFSAFLCIQNLQGERKRKIVILTFLLVAVLSVAYAMSGIGTVVMEQFNSVYANRSGLSDEYGRGTIWKETIDLWVQKGLWFGVGTEQMQYISSKQLSCHNTWLEWLCGCGLIIGGGVVLYFVAMAFGFFRNRLKGYTEDMITYQAIMIGFLGMLFSLVTVDNLTNSYLWFFAITMQKITTQLADYGSLTLCDGEYTTL